MKKIPARYLTGGVIASLVAISTLVLSGCSAGETIGGAETSSGNIKPDYKTVTIHQSRY